MRKSTTTRVIFALLAICISLAMLSPAIAVRATSERSVPSNIRITPPVPYQLYLMDQVQKANDRATQGTLTPEQALAQLERDVAHEQARRKELGYAE